jgi:murein DD-endopeptidase MepM/ murein hydrolase activator NlpD
MAVADGKIIRAGRVSGYGGMILIAHNISGKTINAIYGHLDLNSVSLKAGQPVTKGQVIANLGADKSTDTDGERKHLHFALYEGAPNRINGYVPTSAELGNWINPQQFFLDHGAEPLSPQRQFNPKQDLGGTDFPISFLIPKNMEVEYIPQIKSLNIFSLNGQGDARSRSQVLIRFFDANNFLTLSTVNIFKTESLLVGQDRYSAKRYDIEKKLGAANFVHQPEWRNSRHVVTDIRANDGYSRFFVVAKNPSFDQEIFQNIIDSFKLVK